MSTAYVPRPRYDEDDNYLPYRTHITHPDSRYKVYDFKCMVSQLKLYRWSHSDLFQTQVSIAELHAYLFQEYPQITKRQMGQTMVQSMIDDPRILKGITKNNPKSCMTYVIPDPRVLQYGLEWMLAMWVWRFETREPTPEKVAEIFEEIAVAPEEDIQEFFIDPLMNPEERKRIPLFVDWPALWVRQDWRVERVERSPKSPVPPPRNLSES